MRRHSTIACILLLVLFSTLTAQANQSKIDANRESKLKQLPNMVSNHGNHG